MRLLRGATGIAKPSPVHMDHPAPFFGQMSMGSVLAGICISFDVYAQRMYSYLVYVRYPNE
eukprot:12155545-Karenia_brevis.AAC.1